jgi:hypothetical protein
MLSDSSGQTAFGWRPNSSGSYDLRIVFDGSGSLNASQTTKIVTVERTPTKLTLSSDNPDLNHIKDGSIVLLISELVGIDGSEEKQLVGASITFIVSTPSGKQFTLNAATGRGGLASVQLMINETGDYSAYSVFGSTGYYLMSASESIVLRAISDGGQPGDGNGGLSWLDALLNAIANPGGIGLLIAAGCLLSVTWYLGVKQRELESLDNRSNQRKVRRNFLDDDNARITSGS